MVSRGLLENVPKSHFFKNSATARATVGTEKSLAGNLRQKKREVAAGRLALCVYDDIYAVDGVRAARVGDTYPQQGTLHL
jgi:hypothetical protein